MRIPEMKPRFKLLQDCLVTLTIKFCLFPGNDDSLPIC